MKNVQAGTDMRESIAGAPEEPPAAPKKKVRRPAGCAGQETVC
jgi:hypothetical protein